AELRRRYNLEKRLADRLRSASAQERPRRYAEVYGEYARAVPTAGDDPGSLALQARLLRPWLRPEMTFVEVGAGSGATSRAVVGEGRRVVAIDAVKPQDAAGLEWLPHDRTESLDPQSADMVYSCHVLEHLHPDDLPGHFDQVLRWLKPGAPYLMVTPNRLLGPHDISAYFAETPEGFHLREYSHGDLRRAARIAGFARVAAVGRDGGPRALWPIRIAEAVLEGLGAPTRRLIFDGLESVRRRRPLRPLEQVTLVAFAAGGSNEIRQGGP
ncbi:MAG: class I SAM-dependent methyltransferase, partial [Acidobacteriota bacterium]